VKTDSTVKTLCLTLIKIHLPKPVRLAWLFMLLQLTCISSALAQPQKIESLAANSGLNNTQVYAVAKDQQGFLWFGTAGGVKRFDGYSFTTFKHDKNQKNSLSNENVSVMNIDSQDRLWVGTWGGGVNLYQRESQSFSHFRYDALVSTTLGSDKVQALFEGKDGSIWVGTNGGGLNLYNEKTNDFTRYVHDPKDPYSIGHNRIWSIAEDSQGRIWTATSDGLYRLDRTTQRFSKFGVADGGLDHPEVRALHIDDNDHLWVATRLSFGQLNLVDNSYTAFSLPESTLPSITRMTAYQGTLLLSTFAGVFRFDLASSQFVPAAKNGEWALLGNRDVRQVLVDSTGVVWAATRYSGVIKVFQDDPGFTGWKDYLLKEKLSGLFSQVFSIAERADGKLWLGTGRGLVSFDGNNTFIPHLSKTSLGQLKRLRVRSIAKVANEAIYIGTDAGIFYLDSPDSELELIQLDWLKNNAQSLKSLSTDQQNRLWLVFSAERKVTRWDPSTDQVKHYLHDVDPVFTFVDQQAEVWVGTEGEGLFKINPADNNSQANNKANIQQLLPSTNEHAGLSSRYVHAAIQSDKDTLWFATKAGVDRYSKSKKTFINYSIDMDGIEVSIQSMAMDPAGMLWLSTSHGVYRLDPETGVFHHFTVNDGLNSNSFLARSVVSSSSGHIYFGSIDGVTGFLPAKVKVNTVAPPLVITGVKIDGKSQVPLSKSLQLPSSHKTLEISFSALDFQATEDNKYRTRLIGVNDQWSELTSTNRVSYARLQPDTYQFEVIGSNNHGVWNKRGALLAITVLPAWYQTLLFKITAPLVVFVCLFALYANRIRRHKATEKFLSEKIEQRTQDIFMLGDVGKDIAATFDIDDICQKIYQRLNSTLNPDTFGIGLYDAKLKQIEFIFMMSKGEQQSGLTFDLDNKDPASWSISHQNEFIAKKQKDWDRYAMSPGETLNGLDTQTVVCQPLMVGNNVIGVMVLQSDKFFAFDRSQINVLRIIARHTAIALSNSLSFKELKKTEARFELAMNGANAGTWEWNTQSNELITNDIWFTMLGYTRTEFEQEFGHDFSLISQLIHPEERQKSNDALQSHLTHNSGLYRVEYRVKTATGDWKWILSVGKVALDPDGNSTQRIFGIHLDISESKHMEQTLKEAKDSAEAATQAKSDFLSNMSHEIRTPMNAIIGMSYLALETELNRKQRNYIEKVNRGAESLLGIINDILDFSKIEAGKLDIEKINFSLEDVLNDLANSIALKAEEKGVELYFDFDLSVPNELIGDPLRLGQILLNLGNNAVKFTDSEGEILVSMAVLTDDENGVMLQFSVKDNGIGMNTDQQDKLFKSFSQADASITRKYGGTGLGLAISKTLSELMLGNIWVESELGEGSTFHFTVRLKKQIKQLRQTKYKNVALEKIKVLAVDDSRLSLKILNTQLNSFGFESDQVLSGELALQAIAQADADSPYDVILMDWKMPVMDGVATIRAIRSNSNLQHQPKIIMVTTYSHDEIDPNMAALDVICTLAKPVTPSTLFETISYAIGGDAHKNISVNSSHELNAQVMAKLRGAKVLLVEDNDMNQELATELLRSAEIHVTLAENGQEALNALAETEFDGVLMDCQMPVMDGYMATKEIRLNKKYSQLPIIAMTANAMAGDRDRALAVGMNDHIAKPINVKAMFLTMAKWITPSGTIEAQNETETLSESGPIESINLPDLKGIDSSAGLAIAAGNKALYKRLLIRFKAGQVNFDEQFAVALNSSDESAAERVAHTLRGAAGNIGAKSLAAAAEALEHQCHLKTENHSEALNTVLEQLAQVIVALAALETNEDPKTVNVKLDEPLDIAKITALLEPLTEYLQDYDTDAVDILEELVDMITDPAHLSLLKKAQRAMDDYDFDEAVASVEQFQQALSTMA
jgi:two-component system sensor histidine kinase/response regulator